MEKTLQLDIFMALLNFYFKKNLSIFAYLSENCTSSSIPSIHAHCFLSTVSSEPSITNFSLFHDESWEQKAKEKAAFDRAANFQLSNPFIARFFALLLFCWSSLLTLKRSIKPHRTRCSTLEFQEEFRLPFILRKHEHSGTRVYLKIWAQTSPFPRERIME